MRVVLFALLAASACAPEFQVQGRPYDLQLPTGLTADTPAPLLVMLHGYAASGWAQNVVFPFTDVVDSKGFVLARPNGTLNSQGKRYWNGTDYCCDFAQSGVDDVAFLRALIDDIRKRQAITPGHVFVLGHSNGGFMALRLACEASDVVDGIVSVAGATWLEAGHCPDGRTVPVLLVHGTTDVTIRYEGVDGKYPSAHETFRRFERREGCGPVSKAEKRFDFLGDATEETSREAHEGCRSDVELWTMDGIGHIPSFDSRWTSAVFDWLTEHAR